MDELKARQPPRIACPFFRIEEVLCGRSTAKGADADGSAKTEVFLRRALTDLCVMALDKLASLTCFVPLFLRFRQGYRLRMRHSILGIC
jgi:hypothetical protein